MTYILKNYIINGYDLNSKNIELILLATQYGLTTEIMMTVFIQKVALLKDMKMKMSGQTNCPFLRGNNMAHAFPIQQQNHEKSK